MKRILLSLIAFAGVWMTAGAVVWVTESVPTTTDKRYVLEVNSGYFLMDNKSDSKNTLKSCISVSDVPTLWKVFEESLYSEARKQYLFRNTFVLSTNASKSEAQTKKISFEDNGDGTYKMYHDRANNYYFYGAKNNTALQCDGLISPERNKDKSKFKFISETQWTNHWIVDAYEKAVADYNAKDMSKISKASKAWATKYLVPNLNNASTYQQNITSADLNKDNIVVNLTNLINAWTTTPEAYALLTEDDNFSDNEFATQKAEIEVSRKFNGGKWNTFCIPFEISVSDLKTALGVNEIYVNYLKEVEPTSTHYSMHFANVSGNLLAGESYLVWVPSSISEDAISIKASSKTISAPKSSKVDGIIFQGTYNKRTVPTGSYVIIDDGFYIVVEGKTVNVNAFRGWFEVASGEAKELGIAFDDNDVTGISSVNENASTELSTDWYNIAGQRVNENAKGIIIKNGKKYFVK